MGLVPEIRIHAASAAHVRRDGEYVLYWMIAARRMRWNFALDRAIEWAHTLDKPLVVFEPLRCDYRWSSDRLHRFVVEGMRDNAPRLAQSSAVYYPYVEPAHGASKGLLDALAQKACVVVTDEFPCFFLPHMVAAAASKLAVKVETVDSNGLLPLRATDRDYPTAYAFRRFLQRELSEHLETAPQPDPLADAQLAKAPKLPDEVLQRWPIANLERLLSNDGLQALPIDHTVGRAAFTGGTMAAEATLDRFLDERLASYDELRNVPDAEGSSGLSAYLHFGHVSAHEVFARLMRHEKWTPRKLSAKSAGKRAGWWGTGSAAESFLDQLVTWRELGYNFCHHRRDYDRYESLPDWARATLAQHEKDRRPHVYRLDEFAAGATHDRLWNAAQNQLRNEGRMHNYLRMLWGKKILEWTASPREALETIIALNDRFAVDGRDPNSYSGICWVLGRYDRAWGPERPIFGKIRYMTSENTARKVAVKAYLERHTL